MVSVSDKSEKNSGQLDVDEVIKCTLSDEAKTPKELKKAVIGATGVSERVYYRHLKRLCENNVVEEVAKKISAGRLTKEYALKEAAKEKTSPEWRPQWSPLVTDVSKESWELVAWIRHNPEGWPYDDKDVKSANVIIHLYKFYVDFPKVKRYNMDPDKYVYDWPRVYKNNLRIGHPLPRFFSLKRIYLSKLTGDVNELELRDFPSFLGVKEFTDNDGIKRQVGVGVCRRPDSKLQVFYIEFNPNFSKQWTAALSKEHNITGLQIINSANKALVRKTILHLDKVLKDRRLLIPSKYSLLFKDLRLFNFSYTPPPKPSDREEELMLHEYRETAGNFVHALAASVSCADGLKTNKSKMVMRKKRFKIW